MACEVQGVCWAWGLVFISVRCAQGVLVLAQALCLMRVVRQNVECEVGVGTVAWGGGGQAVTLVDTIRPLP